MRTVKRNAITASGEPLNEKNGVRELAKLRQRFAWNVDRALNGRKEVSDKTRFPPVRYLNPAIALKLNLNPPREMDDGSEGRQYRPQAKTAS
ncbi:MAG: hypothetical protein M3Y72_14260 [Acidobacteriota bacterium]|nr:hypothetical protein [Acidobacteriota bacterium]